MTTLSRAEYYSSFPKIYADAYHSIEATAEYPFLFYELVIIHAQDEVKTLNKLLSLGHIDKVAVAKRLDRLKVVIAFLEGKVLLDAELEPIWSKVEILQCRASIEYRTVFESSHSNLVDHFTNSYQSQLTYEIWFDEVRKQLTLEQCSLEGTSHLVSSDPTTGLSVKFVPSIEFKDALAKTRVSQAKKRQVVDSATNASHARRDTKRIREEAYPRICKLWADNFQSQEWSQTKAVEQAVNLTGENDKTIEKAFKSWLLKNQDQVHEKYKGKLFQPIGFSK